MQLQYHLHIQEAVYKIVRKSIFEGGIASRGSGNVILQERIDAMDVYLAEQIDGGLECHFSPLEATYGIFSIGSLMFC